MAKRSHRGFSGTTKLAKAVNGVEGVVAKAAGNLDNALGAEQKLARANKQLAIIGRAASRRGRRS